MGMRIIAIDDNKTNLKLLEKLLEEKYDVVCFPDASDALYYLQKNEADLILSDLIMPEMTGIGLLKALRNKKIDIPLVIISAYDKKQYIEEAYSHGALHYLVKPINPDELFDVVDNTLSLKPN